MIEVVLSRPKHFDLISWIIRKVTGFDASHATVHFLGTGMLSERRLILEASGQHGVSLIAGERWLERNQPVYSFRLTNEAAGQCALAIIWGRLGGLDYDYIGLWHSGYRFLMARIGIRPRAPRSPKKLFCTELVARWLEIVFEQVGTAQMALRPDEVAPKHLYQELAKRDLFKGGDKE